MQGRILTAVRGKTETSHTLEQRCQGMVQVFFAPQASRCLKLLSSTENTNVSPGVRWHMLFSQLVTETLLSKCTAVGIQENTIHTYMQLPRQL